MPLPILETPTYFVEIPSSKNKIKFRPFLVKEEKILLIAMQEEGTDVLFEAVKQIIRNCTFDQVDVDKLTTYDLEYLFLQLRIKSKGNITSLAFRCEQEDDNNEICGNITNIELDLETVKVQGDVSKSKKIIIDDKTQTGIIMKSPTFETAQKMQDVIIKNDVEEIYKTLPQYIDTVFQGENVYDDFTEKELQEWIESLSDKQFNKVEEFFDTVPKLKADIPIVCAACKHEEVVAVEGLQSFLE